MKPDSAIGTSVKGFEPLAAFDFVHRLTCRFLLFSAGEATAAQAV